MEAVNITRHAKLIKDDEGYWLALTTSAGGGLFSLSKFVPLDGIGESEIGFDDVLQAYMKDQRRRIDKN